jgi:peptidoglycan/LPS O-acetylase OafA/YrhL
MATTKLSGRLHFLDGLRGLACFYVLLFHASSPHIPYPGELGPVMHFVRTCVSRGHFSVVFFIVLSGYSIMLPIARAGTQQLNGGFANYARRRGRRILPPYFVALLGSAALIVVYNAISQRQALGTPVVDDALSAGSVVSHLLLVHNVSFDWAFRINGPLWSVATEWQIYFVFALLLLPLWRRTNSAVAVVAAWLLGSLPFFLLPASKNLFWAAPWFLGSFVLGAWGACVGSSPSYQGSWWQKRAPWGSFAWLAFVVIVALVATGRADSWNMPLVDLIVSLFALFIINACADRTTNLPSGDQTWLVRLLSSRALVYLGGFSYSLYLIQHPVLRLAEKVVAKLTSTHDANIQVHLIVVVPITIAVAWLFAELFERPFASGGVLLPAIRRRLTSPGAAAGTPPAE